MSGVGGSSSFGAQVGHVRRNDAGMLQHQDIVHRSVRPADVLFRRPDRTRIFLAQFGHRVRRDERVLREVKDETHHLVLALAAFLFTQNQSFQYLHLLKQKKFN